MLHCIKSNIFRSFLPIKLKEEFIEEAADPDEEVMLLEPNWEHLQIIYELLLRFVIHSELEPKILKR